MAGLGSNSMFGGSVYGASDLPIVKYTVCSVTSTSGVQYCEAVTIHTHWHSIVVLLLLCIQTECVNI